VHHRAVVAPGDRGSDRNLRAVVSF
jgi:hypothetical protein